MGNEYSAATSKIHKSSIVVNFAQHYSSRFLDIGFTLFKNCTKDYHHIEDVHEAYKLQMCNKWAIDEVCDRQLKWSYSEILDFWLQRKDFHIKAVKDLYSINGTERKENV